MSAKVSGLRVFSDLGQAEIRLKRGHTGLRGQWSDLPSDMQAAILEWVGVNQMLALAWNQGKSQHIEELRRQKDDPSYPLYDDPDSRNPYGEEVPF